MRIFQPQMWPQLDPVTHGYVYYLSRDKPDETAEFRVDYDPRFFEMGVAVLKQWRAWFEEGAVCPRSIQASAPDGMALDLSPCNWCDFKKTCQLDHQARPSMT